MEIRAAVGLGDDFHGALTVIIAIGGNGALIVLIGHFRHIRTRGQIRAEGIEKLGVLAGVDPAEHVVAALKGAEALPAALHAAQLPIAILADLQEHIALPQEMHRPLARHVEQVCAVGAAVDDDIVLVNQLLQKLGIQRIGGGGAAQTDHHGRVAVLRPIRHQLHLFAVVIEPRREAGSGGGAEIHRREAVVIVEGIVRDIGQGVVYIHRRETGALVDGIILNHLQAGRQHQRRHGRAGERTLRNADHRLSGIAGGDAHLVKAADIAGNHPAAIGVAVFIAEI